MMMQNITAIVVFHLVGLPANSSLSSLGALSFRFSMNKFFFRSPLSTIVVIMIRRSFMVFTRGVQ
jgi:hypothetical protein